MLKLEGQVVNVFETPKGTNREGADYGGVHKVQMLCRESLRNGEMRLELVTLRTDDLDPFRKLQGRSVSVPVGAFARNGQLQFYLQKAASPIASDE